MIGITYSVYVDKFARNQFINAIREAVRDVLIEAGRKFLLAAVPRIPIRTGFARSAFRNAEDVFGKVSVDKTSGFRIRGTRGGSVVDRILRYREYYYPPGGGRVLKTTNAGRAFSSKPEDILVISGATVASGKNAFYLKFKIDITYVDLLDRSVWGAFAAGEKAVDDYIRTNIGRRLPDLSKFLTRSQLR